MIHNDFMIDWKFYLGPKCFMILRPELRFRSLLSHLTLKMSSDKIVPFGRDIHGGKKPITCKQARLDFSLIPE